MISCFFHCYGPRWFYIEFENNCFYNDVGNQHRDISILGFVGLFHNFLNFKVSKPLDNGLNICPIIEEFHNLQSEEVLLTLRSIVFITKSDLLLNSANFSQSFNSLKIYI